jgi:hypothetical protein
MIPELTRPIVVMLAASASTLALADVQVSLYATNPSVTPQTISLTASDPVSIERSISNGGSSAFASGSLATGILRSASVAAVPTSQFTDTRANANLLLTDTFSFSPGAAGTAFLDWGFDGRLFTNPNKFGVNAFSSGTLDIALFPIFGGSPIVIKAQLTNAATCQASTDFCSQGETVALRGTLQVPIIPVGYRIDVNLSAGSLWGDEANFGNTSYLYMRLPETVTLNSGSGNFLTAAAPVPEVPEPATSLMLLAGVAILITRVRSRFNQSVHHSQRAGA